MWTLFLGIIIGLAIPPFYKWAVKLVTKKDVAQPMAYGRNMTDAERKADNVYLAFLTVASILIFCCNYVFETDLKAFMQVASKSWQIIGVVFHAAALLMLFFIAKFKKYGNAGDKGGIAVVWVILLILAICTSTGFNFDYFSLR